MIDHSKWMRFLWDCGWMALSLLVGFIGLGYGSYYFHDLFEFPSHIPFLLGCVLAVLGGVAVYRIARAYAPYDD